MSGLEIRFCAVQKRQRGQGQPHTLGQVVLNSDDENTINRILNAMGQLKFEGSEIASDDAKTNLGNAVNVAAGRDFPNANQIFVIGKEQGVDAQTGALAASRALALKDFLLSKGMPARSVAVEPALGNVADQAARGTATAKA
jgi:hypothetical protein